MVHSFFHYINHQYVNLLGPLRLSSIVMLMIYNYLHQFLEEIDMPVNFGEKMVLKFKYYWTKTWMDRKHLFIFYLFIV